MKLIGRAHGTYLAEISDEEIAAIHGQSDLRSCILKDETGALYSAESGLTGTEIDLIGKLQPLIRLAQQSKRFPHHVGDELRRLADEVDKAVVALGPLYPWTKGAD